MLLGGLVKTDTEKQSTGLWPGHQLPSLAGDPGKTPEPPQVVEKTRFYHHHTFAGGGVPAIIVSVSHKRTNRVAGKPSRTPQHPGDPR